MAYSRESLVNNSHINNNNNNKYFCNNCGREGHLYSNCKLPITSIGVIAFRLNSMNEIEYLMICRRDTLGFIDFMRGKYSISNYDYIMNMLKQMTNNEKILLKTKTFDELWNLIWGNKKASTHYKNEEIISREKFNSLVAGVFIKNEFYNLATMIDESNKFDCWEEPEWGFPKGRRNYQENDYECAMREFTEETGFPSKYLVNIQNILPFEEIFTGSNYKSYKHKYYLAHLTDGNRDEIINHKNFEVSKIEWKTYEQLIGLIRHYNLEKKRVITNIHMMLKTYSYFFT
jgi:8-oxo-dGTP pyrophosphatase MutT (NUDIX family)